MAYQRNIVVERDKARRYAKLSSEYAPWAPRVKRLVETAGSEDWGTFVVACALLESVIPREEIGKIERQIEYDRRYAEHVEKAEKRDHSLLKACVIASAITTVIAYALLYAVSTSQVFSFIDANRVAELGAVFTITGMIAFSIVGSISAGFALGSYSDRSKLTPNLTVILSCIAGLSCVFLCPLTPPISLILAWAAWQSSSAMKPQVISALQKQEDYRETHGRRVYARDPRAPWFVKNAIRLAGIYQGSKESIGTLARDALSRNQSDYGAFIVYEAILAEHHAKRRAEESVRQVDEIANQASNSGIDSPASTADELRAATRSIEQTRESGIVARGLITSAIVAIAMCCVANTSTWFAAMPNPVRGYVIFAAVIALCFIGVLVGWRSSVRVASMYGLDLEEKRLSSVFRPAWFVAWTMLIGIYLIFIVSVF